MIKVLIVDDETPIREWLEFCVKKVSGFEVVGTASNGEDGYKLFKEYSPDIVFTDICMPIKNGLEMIEMIQKIKQDVYTIILTSHIDFEYARKSLQLKAKEYILKTEISNKNVEELLIKGRNEVDKNILNDNESHYEIVSNRNSFLKSLILKDEFITIDEDVLKKYNIKLKGYPLFVINIFNECNERIILPKIESIKNVVKFNLDLEHIIVIANIEEVHSIKEQREKCIEYCKEILLKYHCRIGVSDVFNKITDLKIALQQSTNRMILGFYNKNERIISEKSSFIKRTMNSEKLRVKLIRELINQNYSEVISLKNKIKEEIEREKPIDINYVKELYSFIVISIINFTNESIDIIEADYKVMNEKILSANYLEDITTILEESFYILNNKYSSSMNNYSYSIRKAIKYMNDNYCNGINLSDVARHVSLSSEYLSRLFKDEIGINFIVYLNNIRLKHAIKMLEKSDLKVYEIAEKVGYSNLSYFSTVFKKNFGINPFEYKNKNISL